MTLPGRGPPRPPLQGTSPGDPPPAIIPPRLPGVQAPGNPCEILRSQRRAVKVKPLPLPGAHQRRVAKVTPVAATLPSPPEPPGDQSRPLPGVPPRVAWGDLDPQVTRRWGAEGDRSEHVRSASGVGPRPPGGYLLGGALRGGSGRREGNLTRSSPTEGSVKDFPASYPALTDVGQLA